MTDNPYPQLTERISNLPLEILRVTPRRKIAKYLDCGDDEQESKGYINLARLAGFSDSTIEVFSQEKSPTEALLAEWQLRKPTVGKLFECLQFLGRDDVIKDCISCVENDAISFMSGLPDVTSALSLTPTGERKTMSKPTLKGSKEIESKKQSPDTGETTLPIDAEDSAAFDKFLFDDPTKIATVDDLRNPGEEQVRYDAFVSVNFDSKKDLEFVKEMAEVLEKKFNMKLFIPFRDSIPGSAEHSMSAYLIDVRCNKVLVMLSKSFLKCSACDFQLKFAQCLHPSVRTKKIIPVMIEPGTPVPLILRFVTVCDFTQVEMAEWVLERLICALRAPIPAIEIGEEDPSDDYTTDTSLHEIKLELKMAVFNEVFNVTVDEDQSNTESARDSHNSSSLAQSQKSSSLEPNEKPKENKKSLLGSFFSKLSTRKKKKKEKEQNEEDEFNRIAKKLAELTQKDLINGKDAKTTSENKKHGPSVSGDANDISESQNARNTNYKKKAPLTDSDGDAVLDNLQVTMPFHLNPDNHSIDSGQSSLSPRKDSVTDTQDVEYKDKKQQNMKNCEEDLNIAALGQIHFHNSSRQSPAGYLTHTAVDTQGRGDKIDRPVTKSQFPIHMTSDQMMHSPSLKRSDNIPLSQGLDEITAHCAQLDESHTKTKHGCYQFGTNRTSIPKEQSKDWQLRPIQCANKLAISQRTEEENAHLGTSVNATGATVLQRLKKNASGNEIYNCDRADPVFV